MRGLSSKATNCTSRRAERDATTGSEIQPGKILVSFSGATYIRKQTTTFKPKLRACSRLTWTTKPTIASPRPGLCFTPTRISGTLKFCEKSRKPNHVEHRSICRKMCGLRSRPRWYSRVARKNVTAHPEEHTGPRNVRKVLEKFNAILQLEGEGKRAAMIQSWMKTMRKAATRWTPAPMKMKNPFSTWTRFQARANLIKTQPRRHFTVAKERNTRKRPLRFMEEAEEQMPDIDEDVFAKKQRELTQRLIDRDRKALAEIDEILAEPDLTARDRKKLSRKRSL